MFTLPSNSDCFKALLAINLISAIWNIISDCDETFNYWEPLHFLIYGEGFQTWEYSPTYALRSYSYIWIYGIIGKLLASLQVPKIIVFYVIRLQCAVIMSLCQLYLFSVLKRRSHDTLIVVFTLLISALSCGSYISSSAFLPSSFAMYCSYVYLAAWLDKKYKIAVFAVATSSILGWPFSAALGIPIAIDLVLIRRKFVSFVIMAVVSGISLTLPMILIDSYYFGKLVCAPLNIVKYNVFSVHGADLYGTAPFCFYFQNYFLNFNFGTLFAFSSPVISIIGYLIKRDHANLKLLLFASPFFLWNIIFFSQAHKEERFLFPCYPFLCFAGGLCISTINTVAHEISKKYHVVTFLRYCFLLGFGVLFCTLSLSRILLLTMSFRAPFSVYGYLSQETSMYKNDSVVCVGKEWHRFPNSFFLKSDLKLHFLKSEFSGQLPAKFSAIGNQSPTRVVHQHFNEKNEEEFSRYIKLSNCDFIVDKDEEEESEDQPRYVKMTNYSKIFSAKFLAVEKSKGIFKSFYIPFAFNRKNVFVDYVLLQKITK